MRRVGLLAAVAVLTLLAGCEAALLEPDKGRHDIDVRNDDTTSHRVSLEVVDGDGNTVQSRTQVVPAGGTWSANRLAHAGTYTIRVTVDGEDGEYVDTVELPIEGEDTVSATVVRIHRDGSLSGETTVRGTAERLRER